MDPELKEKLDTLEKKIEETRKFADRTYKIILWTMIGSVVMFILPLIVLAFVIPYFMSAITSSLNGL